MCTLMYVKYVTARWLPLQVKACDVMCTAFITYKYRWSSIYLSRMTVHVSISDSLLHSKSVLNMQHIVCMKAFMIMIS